MDPLDKHQLEQTEPAAKNHIAEYIQTEVLTVFHLGHRALGGRFITEVSY